MRYTIHLQCVSLYFVYGYKLTWCHYSCCREAVWLAGDGLAGSRYPSLHPQAYQREGIKTDSFLFFTSQILSFFPPSLSLCDLFELIYKKGKKICLWFRTFTTLHQFIILLFRYTVKNCYRFSRPLAGMTLTKLTLAGNDLIIPGQEEFG